MIDPLLRRTEAIYAREQKQEWRVYKMQRNCECPRPVYSRKNDAVEGYILLSRRKEKMAEEPKICGRNVSGVAAGLKWNLPPNVTKISLLLLEIIFFHWVPLIKFPKGRPGLRYEILSEEMDIGRNPHEPYRFVLQRSRHSLSPFALIIFDLLDKRHSSLDGN